MHFTLFLIIINHISGAKPSQWFAEIQTEQTHSLSPTEIVRAMTHVINQGMSMYWGTSRWSAMEIMVSHFNSYKPNMIPFIWMAHLHDA